MRVALFFDGKNHMKDLRRTVEDRWLDHGALARWVVEKVGGSTMFAAFYYTGVPSPQEDSGDRHALSDLLDELERRPGFFVRRFNRRATTRECPHCEKTIAYTEEKMVDTSLVTDMVMLAVRDAYDIAVVFSGDLDVAPGLQAVQQLGKQAWIATFGEQGLSRSLTRSAWSVIDLGEHIDAFAYPELEASPGRRVPSQPEQVDQEMLRELRRAELHFHAGGGFVGAHYFIHRWKGHAIPDAPEERRQSLQRLMGLDLAETYVVDGKTAVRSLGEPRDEPARDEVEDELDLDDLLPPGSDDEETVEMRLTEAMKRLRGQITPGRAATGEASRTTGDKK